MSEPRFVSNRLISFIDGSGDTKIAPSADPHPVNIGSATFSVTADGVEIKNDVGNPIPTSVSTRNPTTTSVPGSAVSVTILAANANRKGISVANDIRNNKTGKVYNIVMTERKV